MQFSRRRWLAAIGLTGLAVWRPAVVAAAPPQITRPIPFGRWEYEEYSVPAGSRPHDIAPAANGSVWYCGQANGTGGLLDPATGIIRDVKLGPGSAPHGVIVGPDGHAWFTDGGQNSIVRLNAQSWEVSVWPLPRHAPNANLNTAAFDADGVHWFTGQSGYYGRLDLNVGTVDAWEAPKGRGPYGICATPSGDIYYASLAGSYVGKVDRQSGSVTVLNPPTSGQGTRRVWSDSKGRIWCSQWDAGQVAVYDPATDQWREWKLPGAAPKAYAVYVDEKDIVWLTDWGGNNFTRFDPATEQFEVFPLPQANRSNVRQLLGRPGEVWGASLAIDKLVVLRER